MVRLWPNSAADARPVNIVATVDEYFFNIVSAQVGHWPYKVICWHTAHNKETVADSAEKFGNTKAQSLTS